MLAEARTLEDIRTIRDMAEAARAYATAARLGSEAINHAAEIKLLAERKAGELLRDMPKDRGGRPSETGNGSLPVSSQPTLDQLGITKMQSHRWQTLARVDDQQFGAIVEEAKVEGTISTSAAITKIRSIEARDRYANQPAPVQPRIGALPVLIVQADALNLPIADDSVHLQVTSPPYGLDVDYQDSADAPDAWIPFMQGWLAESYRVALEGGRLAVNVPLDTTRGGCRPTYAQTVACAEVVGWTYRFTIVWNEDNVSKSIARGSVDSPAAPHVMAPVEMIAVFYKREWNRTSDQRPDLQHDDWLRWTNGVWTFPGESRPWAGHPAPFPEELPRRLIRLLSFPGDTVLDPFLGSGTTALAAWRAQRRFVGCDISTEYVAAARHRLARAIQEQADANR
jgi:site-specific DNA-methyltransferase (adenine-specific)